MVVALVLGAGAGDAATPPKTACVNADVGNVRVLAGDGEDIIARLRIGTRIFVREKRGEWSRIEAGAARGWMKATLLSDDCVTVDELVARATSAATPADAVRWADRALALDPFSPEAQAAATAAYAKAKIAGVKALALKELREGRTAIFLASCRDGEAMLVAQAKPTGLEALLTTTDLLPPPTDLQTLLPALSGTTWFTLAPDGISSKLEGTPFPSPAISASEGADGLSHVRLGACSASGTLYATRAITAAASVPLGEETASRAHAAWDARTAAATTTTAASMAPARFAAELFVGEDVKDQGLGVATSDAAWALLQGTEVVESVTGVSHVAIAAVGDGRRIAVISHEEANRSVEGAGRRFTVIVIRADRTREKVELALEWGAAPAE